MYGMPKRRHERGRPGVGGESGSRRRRSSSRGGGGKRGGVVPGPPVQSDSISTSPSMRRSSPRSSCRGRSSGGCDAGEHSQRQQRRRRHRNAVPPQLQAPQRLQLQLQLPGQRQGRERDGASPRERGGGGASPRVSTGRECVVATATGTATATAATATVAAAAVAVAVPAADGAGAGGLEADRAMSFRDTASTMGDHERAALLSSLDAAYSQVNDLTHELKITLDRLNGTKEALAPLAPQDPKVSHKPAPLPVAEQAEGPSEIADLRTSLEDASFEDAYYAAQKRITLHKIFCEEIPRDNGGSDGDKDKASANEGPPSTHDAVRRLQVEVEELRRKNAQASAKEEEYKSDISNMQRHIALLESKVSKAAQQDMAAAPDSSSSSSSSSKHNNINTSTNSINTTSTFTNTTINNSSSGSSSSSRFSSSSCNNNGTRPCSAKLPTDVVAYCTTPGGTRYPDKGDTKSLVARVAEAEETLKSSSVESARAKQEQHSARLKGRKLQKSLQKAKHDLAKSRAMNGLLQNEIDRLQAPGSGWQRQWLNGLQKPLSPEPTPIKVCGKEGGANRSWRWLEASAPESHPTQDSGGNSHASSPAVLVTDLDLDKNNLVYTTDRSQSVYLDNMKK